MDVGIRVRSLLVIFAFFWVLAANNSQGIRHFSDILSEEDIPDIDEDKVEEIWLHCTRELVESTRGNANLIFYLSEVAAGKNENMKLDRPHRVKEIMRKTINDLPTQERYLLLECLRSEEAVLLHNESSMTWISKFQDLFSKWSTIPRRFLRGGRKHHHRGRKHHHRRGSPRRNRPPIDEELDEEEEEAPSPSPYNKAPASSPFTTLSLNKAVNPPAYRAPASSPSIYLSQLRVVNPPQPLVPEKVPSPAPLNRDPPSPTPSPTPPVSKPIIAAPPKSRNRSPPKAIANPPPPRAQTGAGISSGGSNKQKDEHYIIAVSVVGGLAALIGLALVFICIVMNRRKNSSPVEGQREEGKDEKPLLHFSSSDVSAASSQQSCIMGKPGDKISKTSSAESDARNSSKLETQSSEAGRGNNGSLLPLPPGKSAPPEAAAPPPPPPPKPAAPRAPPPPMARPPPNPPKNGKPGPSPLGPHQRGKSSFDEGSESGDPDAPKTKLKPFFWDKVQANPDHSMVWHDIKEGSFQFNEEMMESLFGYIPSDKAKNENKKDSSNSQSQPTQIRIIDSKKAQNLAILLKALNVTTEEVCDALREGNELPLELIQTLLKMAPTTDEELKLRLFSGDISQLGPAERFLKVVVDIPFAFKRLEALLFMCSMQEEVSSVMESFTTLEVACNELRNSRLFLKLLEAVLKTGNRMNDGTFRGGAQAFKLDTLLKLSDVKGTDGKTNLLLFVVQEIIRSEGVRAARRMRESQSMSNFKPEDLSEGSTQETEECHRKLGLQVVSGLSSELEDVKKAAVLDGEIITGTVSKLGHLLTKTKDFLNNELKTVDDAGELCDKLATFLEKAEADTTKLIEEDKRIMELVRNTGDYFHGNAGKDEGLRLFTIVRDFLVMLDKVCREVRTSAKWSSKPSVKKETVSESSPKESHNDSLNETRLKLFPAIQERRIDDDSSSDDESSSP